MTSRISDIFENEHPHPALQGMHIYGIIQDSIMNHERRRSCAILAQPEKEKLCKATACFEGYVSRYRLSAAGELTLVSFEYPFGDNTPGTVVNEQVRGNFWMMVRESFQGKPTYLTFRNSVMVEDSDVWVVPQ